MKKVLPVLFLVSLGFIASAQEQLTSTIRGTIVDVESRIPIIGANVILLNSDPIKGSVTDIDGRFKLTEVPVGRHGIRITYLGYKELVLPNIVVNTGREVVLELEMQEAVITAQEVKVTAKKKGRARNEMALISSRAFDVDQTNRYAGSLGDPSRMAQNFAGVVGANDQRNDIIIRGNSPVGLLWRLEGIDIPSPNHFSAQGANGGPVSILNNNTLSNSDFMTGAFPAEYGNANSGAFDLRIRNGNNEKTEFIGQVGFNGLEMLAEGPFSSKSRASYLVSYRYSTLGVFDAIGVEFGTAGIPQYQDLTFKVNIPTKKAGTFRFFGVGGISNILLLDSEKEADDNSFGVEERQDVDFGSRMGMTGVSHTITLSKKAYLKSTIALTGDQLLTKVDSLSDTNDPFRVYQENSSTTRNIAHIMYNRKVNAKHSMRFGFIGTRYNLDLDDEFYSNENQDYQRLRKFKGNTELLQGYGQWQYHITSRFTFNSGLHYMQLTHNNTSAVEPRMGLKWEMSSRQSLSFGYGMHHQAQQMVIYFYESRLPDNTFQRNNENIDLSRSQHFVLGYNHNLNKDLRFKAEAYYQYLDQIAVDGNERNSFSMLNFGTDFTGAPTVDTLVNGGTGYNYGLEFTLEKFFSKNYYFLATASVFESKYEGSDGIERNTAFNGNYVANALAGMEIPMGKDKNNLLVIDVKGTVAGGRRFTPIDVERSIQEGEVEYVDEEAFSRQFADYFRADFKVMYRTQKKKFSQEFGITVQNIFDTQNALLQVFNSSTGEVETETQLGRLIIPRYRILF